MADDVDIEEIEIDDGIYRAGNEDAEMDNDSDIEATQRETEEIHQRIQNTARRGKVWSPLDFAKSGTQ